MPASLTAKTMVITGASSGIGKAVALALADRSATLCLAGRRIEALEAVAHQAKGKAHRVECCQADLTVDGDVDRLRSAVLSLPSRAEVTEIRIRPALKSY